MTLDPDVLRDTDDDGCPWCPYDHVAVGPCPEGEWLDEDGDPLADDAVLTSLAGQLADVRPAARRKFCTHFRCRVSRTAMRAVLFGGLVISSYLLGMSLYYGFRAVRAMLGLFT